MRRTGPPVAWTVAILTAVLAGCGDSVEIPELPESPVLLAEDTHGLIMEPYVRLHDRPDVAAAVIGHGRAGDVLRVIGRTADHRWFELEAPDRYGWVRRDYIRVFDSRSQAINGRALLED